MLQRFHHNLRLAVSPFLVVVGLGLCAATVWVLAGVWRAERTASLFTGTLGDGLDELLADAEQGTGLLQSIAHSHVLTVVAITAVVVSVGAALLHLFRMLRGPGDAVGFVGHLFGRIGPVSWQAPRHHWGRVHDAESGHALPFSRVHLVSVYGHTVATTVSDMAGRYGFPMRMSDAAQSGLELHVRKDGYHSPAQQFLSSSALFATVSATLSRFDIPMHLAAHHQPQRPGLSRAGAVLSTGAFWIGIATAPLVSAVAPNALSMALATSLVIAVLGRIAGLGRHHVQGL